MHLDRIALDFFIPAVEMLFKLLPGNDRVRIVHELVKQRELTGGERYLLVAQPDPALGGVEPQRACE